MIKKKIIFFQSVSNIDFILTKLQNSSKNRFVIIVTGGNFILKLLKKLKVKKKFGTEIFSYAQPSIFNILNLYQLINRIRKKGLKNKYINYEFESAYFGCTHTDFITPIFLSILNIKKIYFYKDILNKKNKIRYSTKFSLYWLIKKFFYKIILYRYNIFRSNIRINDLLINDQRVLNFELLNDKVSFKEEKISKINQSFKFKLTSLSSRNTILYLDSFEEKKFGKTFNIINTKIFEILNNLDFKIVIKKHPRIPLSKTIKLLNNKSILKSSIPIELYKMEKVKIVIGCASLGLANLARNNSDLKVISTLNFFIKDKKNSSIIKYYQKYLNLFNEKILYPKNLKQLTRYLT